MFSLRRPLPWPRAKEPVVYEEIGNEVSVEGTICQAAQAIDIAGKLAADQGNSQTLLQTAESWTKLADFIVALSEHQKKDKKKETPFGFQSSQDDEEEIEEKDEDVRSDED